jgi:virginiamycin A acetyltransferase
MNIPGIKRIELYFFRRKWRKLNPHNTSSAVNKFPLNKVKVGKKTYGGIKAYCYSIESDGALDIGDYVSLSPNVEFILDGNHYINGFTTFPLKSVFMGKQFPIDASSKGPIIIEDEVWIGTNSTIMSGIRIGRGSVIAAGSVVVKDVAPFTIVGGNPAKFIKYRIPEEMIPQMERFKLSDLSCQEILASMEVFYQQPSESGLEQIFKRSNVL